MTQTTYAVTGMTCGHCASSVREELGELSGVREVDVDLGTGNVLVTSETALELGQVEQAVRVAGYQLVR
ncbi:MULTISPECIES: heavy-metal-associated domain-containing protein [unclassified Amycolatopsis]|uniref:heavy-metal-associated domain-containing protein n=1 Tax=unclassified Amycolatopsis TaxID=2618356 RepID=UPI002E1293BD|nr:MULTISPECIES: heavy-metal-associated domain-containing protein [unclassified Amycolatopsis]WSJ79527.1 heavy-metal-associated domain-containing protein [Amycolatopsis sp. NBC_01307]WSK76986.1 heavy-metal-associated domain-containing protein [Amycolatopsis sp. NBC_01286]